MTSLKLKTHRIFLILSLLFLTVGCDQVTKVMARDALKNLRVVGLFSNTLIFQYAENTGAFLSLGSALPDTLRFWIFTICVSLFLVATLFLLFQKNNMDLGTTVALTLLVGGGVGNLIDRAFRGSVTDFIFFGWGPIQTGVFNVADMTIVAGILLYSAVHLTAQTKAKS
jgi:signal peptidase II